MNLRDQLKRDEGTVLHVYPDSRGFLTLGTGRLVDGRRGGGISQAESDFMLGNDITRVAAELAQRLPWTTKLDDARNGALMNMTFNLGIEDLLKFTQFLGLMEQGAYAAAAADLKTTPWYGEVGDRGKRVCQQIETGDWV